MSAAAGQPLATILMKGPHVDFAALSPLIALLGGGGVVVLVGLLGSIWIRLHAVARRSTPRYGLCATELRREHSLASGLKYLIIGSVGSATLLYGLAMIYGATGATDFTAIATALSSGGLASDPLTLTGIALCVAG